MARTRKRDGRAASASPTSAAWSRASPPIVVKALDRQGRPIELRLKNFPARVAQHETDHLDGILFFDRMTSMQSLTFLDEYSRYHSKDDED